MLNKENVMDIIGIVLEPKRFAVHDGPGIRTTFFLKGCPLHCLWCHNPESISTLPQMGYFSHRCVSCGECVPYCRSGAHSLQGGIHHFDASLCRACGACVPGCFGGALKLYGERMTVSRALTLALEDVNFYRESGGGVTLSGGEPLMQPKFALEFLKQLKAHKLHTALDSCCFVSREALEAALPLTDLFLIDFKHADAKTHQRLTGQSNKWICENLKFLSANGAKIEIRIPFVPGCNDSDENMAATGKFLGTLNITCVKLLPYHALARSKYAALGLPDTMVQTKSPADDALHHAANILKEYGLDAYSGRD